MQLGMSHATNTNHIIPFNQGCHLQQIHKAHYATGGVTCNKYKARHVTGDVTCNKYRAHQAIGGVTCCK